MDLPLSEEAAASTSKRTGGGIKLVHVVSVLGALLVSLGLYESMQSAASMQQMYQTIQKVGVEYAAGGSAAVVDDSSSSSGNSSSPSPKAVTRNRTVAPPLHLNLPRHAERVAESAKDEKTPTKDEKPLNIVLLYADDWTMKTLGLLNNIVKTPNLDELAAGGVLFTNNCVTTSICWISRSTMLTGQYAGFHEHKKIFQQVLFDDNKWNSTLFPTLKHAGYHTGFVGKWHAPSPPEHMSYTFDYRNFYYGRHWEMRNNEPRHVTDLNREDALLFLRKRPKDKNFALTVAFFATHAWDGQKFPLQYQHMPTSSAWYANDTIPNPKTNTQQAWDDLPWFFEDRNEGRGRWRDRYDTPERYQVSMKNYYRMATEVDEVCGDIIKELKEQGVYDNTLIIFTTDNGNFHGEHGMSDKWYAFEESIKVPLIIKDPRMPKHMQGTSNGEFTLSVDLAPTMLSAAKVATPSVMQGRDMAPLYLQQPVKAAENWRKDFFYEWTQGDKDAVGHNEYFHIPAVFALIEKEYKYVYWPQLKYEQLYHYAQDPFEEHDIYNSTAQTNMQLLIDMKARYAYLKNISQNGHPV